MDVNAQNNDESYQRSALHMAASFGDHLIKAVKILLENGANAELKDKDGKAALQLAKEGSEVYKLLENYSNPATNAFVASSSESLISAKESLVNN
jgi:ankyrin repeat protein